MISLVSLGEDKAARYEDKAPWLDETAIIAIERRCDLLVR